MFKVGDRVRIIKLVDDCGEPRFIGKCATITALRTGNMTGETPLDPLYEVHSRRAGEGAFWEEEMELL
jgi:hypothetical protein